MLIENMGVPQGSFVDNDNITNRTLLFSGCLVRDTNLTMLLKSKKNGHCTWIYETMVDFIIIML